MLKFNPMSFIPNAITDIGFEPTGQLSSLYFKKSNHEFYAGLFNKNNQLHLAITYGKDKYLMIPIVEKDMDNLLRGITTLYEIILHAKQIISMPDGNTKNDNRIKLMLKVFYQFKLSQIKTMPNAFYHWNEYYFNRQLIKCQTYTV
jgi:hypothetical protein